MNFEDKIHLAVEMANFRIEAEANAEGYVNRKLVGEEELPSLGKQGADLYSECVRAMFKLIGDLEKVHEED